MKKQLNVYIATPVNGRKEATMELKQEAARQRVEFLRKMVKAVFPDAVCWSSFDFLVPKDLREMSEGEIMGRCVWCIIDKIDHVLMDYDHTDSKGCMLEYSAATIYRKNVIYIDEFRQAYAIQLSDFGIKVEGEYIPRDKKVMEYVTNEETHALVNCMCCGHCLPPSKRKDGKLCELKECNFEKAVF